MREAEGDIVEGWPLPPRGLPLPVTGAVVAGSIALHALLLSGFTFGGGQDVARAASGAPTEFSLVTSSELFEAQRPSREETATQAALEPLTAGRASSTNASRSETVMAATVPRADPGLVEAADAAETLRGSITELARLPQRDPAARAPTPARLADLQAAEVAAARSPTPSTIPAAEAERRTEASTDVAPPAEAAGVQPNAARPVAVIERPAGEPVRQVDAEPTPPPVRLSQATAEASPAPARTEAAPAAQPVVQPATDSVPLRPVSEPAVAASAVEPPLPSRPADARLVAAAERTEAAATVPAGEAQQIEPAAVEGAMPAEPIEQAVTSAPASPLPTTDRASAKAGQPAPVAQALPTPAVAAAQAPQAAAQAAAKRAPAAAPELTTTADAVAPPPVAAAGAAPAVAEAPPVAAAPASPAQPARAAATRHAVPSPTEAAATADPAMAATVVPQASETEALQARPDSRERSLSSETVTAARPEAMRSAAVAIGNASAPDDRGPAQPAPALAAAPSTPSTRPARAPAPASRVEAAASAAGAAGARETIRSAQATPAQPVTNHAAAVRSFVSTYDGGECFLLAANAVSDDSAAIAGFGASADPFVTFNDTFTTMQGFEADLGVRQVSEAHCPLISLLKSRGRALPETLIDLTSSSIVSGGLVAGKIVPQSGEVDRAAPPLLFLIDDAGQVHDARRFLQAGPEGWMFSFPLTLTGEAGEAPVLLLAVFGVEPADRPEPFGSLKIEDFAPQIDDLLDTFSLAYLTIRE